MKQKTNKTQPQVKPLTRELVNSRIEEGFTTAYVTLISIIQGVAFGILVSNTVINVKTLPVSQCLLSIAYSFTSLLLLIAVTYEHLPFLVILRWQPRPLDVVILFLLGVFEISPMFYLASPRWWWLLNSVFSLVAVGAYSNTMRNTPREMFGVHGKAHQQHRHELRFDIAASLCVSFLCLISFLANVFLDFPIWINLFPLLLFLLAIIAVLWSDRQVHILMLKD